MTILSTNTEARSIALPTQSTAVDPEDASSIQDDLRLEKLLRLKGMSTITVCLPTNDDAETISSVVGELATKLVRRCRLVDEIIVMDGGSSDATCDEAARAGATVLTAKDTFQRFGEPLGRGDLIWRAVGAASGDIIVWIDADVTNFSADSVARLIEPLLEDDSVSLVRGTTSRGPRPIGDGGRVTEAVARPVLALLDPEFSSLREPFGGEYAARRTLLRSLEFEPDYGVEIGILVDVARRYGMASIREVDLGVREHRYRSLSDRAQQTRQLLRAALERAGRTSVRGALPLRPAHDSVPSAGGGVIRSDFALPTDAEVLS